MSQESPHALLHHVTGSPDLCLLAPVLCLLQRELYRKDQPSREGLPSVLECGPGPFRKVVVKEATPFHFTASTSQHLRATPAMQEAGRRTRFGVRLQSLALARQGPSECNFDQPGNAAKGPVRLQDLLDLLGSASWVRGAGLCVSVVTLGERHVVVSVVTLGERHGVVCECGHAG